MEPMSGRGVANHASEERSLGRRALADAAPARAVAHSRAAALLAKAAGHPQLAARAATDASQALTHLNRLLQASAWALHAAQLADESCRGSETHFWAVAQYLETLELRGWFAHSVRGFEMLERAAPREPGWPVDLRVHCLNHLISGGIKLSLPEVAEDGINRGVILEPAVRAADERSAWLQWWALYECWRARPEKARERLEESFLYRAPTRKRQITRHFPEAHVLLAEGRDDEGIVMLDAGIALADQAGMARYAEAGRALRDRLFIQAAA